MMRCLSLNSTCYLSVYGCVLLYMHLKVCIYLCVCVWVPLYVHYYFMSICTLCVCGAVGGFTVVYPDDCLLVQLQKHMTDTSCH